ncbi:MAG: energy-coupling factor ABC transporter ATP-binding protein [Candidatus Thorarchaeota archaeon]
MPIVSFKNFSFRYLGSEVLALHDISLNIDQGEYILVSGPSGCGKTTFCRAINGLIPHFHRGYLSGDVFVASQNTREKSVAELAKTVGMVFQNPSNQLVTLNVEKELAFGPENLGVPPAEIRKKVDEMIELLDLDHLREKHPHEMSGGEQQAVAMAATLALEPDILIADEPTSNLDPQSAERILGIISSLNKQGLTVVLVEHRLDIVSSDATRLLLMNDGEIVADGPPRQVLVSEICEEIGVGVPKVVQVYKRLRNHGIDLDRVPLSGDELARLAKEVYVS